MQGERPAATGLRPAVEIVRPDIGLLRSGGHRIEVHAGVTQAEFGVFVYFGSSESHVKWNLRNGIPEISSPVLHRGRLYLVRNGGVATCLNAATGDVIYRKRLGAVGQYSVSPGIVRRA